MANLSSISTFQVVLRLKYERTSETLKLTTVDMTRTAVSTCDTSKNMSFFLVLCLVRS